MIVDGVDLGEQVGGVGDGEVAEPDSDSDKDAAADALHVWALTSEVGEASVRDVREHDRCSGKGEHERRGSDCEGHDAAGCAAGDGGLARQTGKQRTRSTEPCNDEPEPVEHVCGLSVGWGDLGSLPVNGLSEPGDSPQRKAEDAELGEPSSDDRYGDSAA